MNITLAEAQAHADKHGYELTGTGFDEAKVVPSSTLRRARQPNKTEAAYGLILEAMKRKGDILRYEYEGITLRWADMKYTPDFICFSVNDPWWSIKLIEVKGAHIWDRDIVRFKGARAYWPEFSFELHQKKGGQWTRIM